MKSLLGVLLLTCTFSVFAGERCSIQAKKVIYSSHKKVSSSCSSNWGRPLEFNVNSWQECYEKAVVYASRNPFFTTFEGIKGRIGGLSSCPIVSGHVREAVFVEWEYNDGFLFDSKGKVTKFSDEYSAPDKGDLTYESNGQKLF